MIVKRKELEEFIKKVESVLEGLQADEKNLVLNHVALRIKQDQQKTTTTDSVQGVLDRMGLNKVLKSYRSNNPDNEEGGE